MADDEGPRFVDGVASGVSPNEGVDVDRGVGTDAGVPADEVRVDTGKEEAALSSREDFSSSSE